MELRKVKCIRLNRYYLKEVKGAVKSLELHGYSDASNSACTAAVYLKAESEGNTETLLVGSRTRVAPLEAKTTPRLELLDAIILSRLVTAYASALQGVMKVDKILCWVDSTAVLYWILGSAKEWKQFVQNRIMEIRSLIPKEHWRFCPGELNPADLPTRGVNASELMGCDLWWYGPSYLTSDPEYWPEQPTTSKPPLEVIAEMKAEFKPKSESTSVCLSFVKVGCELQEIIQLERYSSTQKLFHVTVMVFRFIGNLKAKIRHLELKLHELSVQETEDAENAWMREIQRSILGSHKFKEMQNSLGSFFDKAGVLRCGGRLKFAPLELVTKHPILLPQKNYLSELIIRDCHEDVMHNGLTLTQLRSRYWIPKGRQTVRRVIYKCVICRRAEGKAYAVPPPPDLPEFRVQQDFPFTNCGVDFAGPLYVRPMFEKDGEMHKVYIALFT